MIYFLKKISKKNSSYKTIFVFETSWFQSSYQKCVSRCFHMFRIFWSTPKRQQKDGNIVCFDFESASSLYNLCWSFYHSECEVFRIFMNFPKSSGRLGGLLCSNKTRRRSLFLQRLDCQKAGTTCGCKAALKDLGKSGNLWYNNTRRIVFINIRYMII